MTMAGGASLGDPAAPGRGGLRPRHDALALALLALVPLLKFGSVAVGTVERRDGGIRPVARWRLLQLHAHQLGF